jgi:hypothetical protein
MNASIYVMSSQEVSLISLFYGDSGILCGGVRHKRYNAGLTQTTALF